MDSWFSPLLILDELQPHSCRFIEGDDHLFCGRPQQEKSSYCPVHHALCYLPKERRK